MQIGEDADEKVPAAHAMQDVDPDPAEEPVSQATGELSPAVAQKLPAGHAVMAESPDVAQMLPAPQLVHALEPDAAEYVPATQLAQVDADVAPVEPR